MDEQWFRDWVARSEWVFAKTMPANPHWYTLRARGDAADFERAVIDIRASGTTRLFQEREYTCYEFEGWRYWSMGAPVHETILINRARI